MNKGFIFLLLYIALIFIRPQEYILFVQSFHLNQIFFLLSLWAWFFTAKNDIRLPQYKLVLLMPVMMLVSNVFGGWIFKGVDMATKFTITLLLYFMITSLTTTQKKLVSVMFVFVVASLIMSVHGIQQSIDGIGWTGIEPTFENRIRYVGIFNDPNDLGMFLVLTMPFVIYFISNSKSFFRKIFLFTGLGSMTYALYLTNSRGSILGVMVMVGLYFKERYGAFKTGMLVLSLSPLAFLLPSRLSKVNASEASAAGRVYAWYDGIQMLKTNPITGIGAGRFTDYHFRTAHNSFVLAMSEMGAIGYFVWFTILILSFQYIYLLKNAIKDKYIDSNTGMLIDREKANFFNLVNAFYFSYFAIFTTIFFLSRTYNMVLFIFIALSNALVILAIKNGIVGKEFVNRPVYMKYFIYSNLSIIGLYIVIRILLGVM